jgi:hypothetical protein
LGQRRQALLTGAASAIALVSILIFAVPERRLSGI